MKFVRLNSFHHVTYIQIGNLMTPEVRNNKLASFRIKVLLDSSVLLDKLLMYFVSSSISHLKVYFGLGGLLLKTSVICTL